MALAMIGVPMAAGRNQKVSGGRHTVAEPSLIRDYRDVLAAELPEPICDEILDGLAQTNYKYLSRGLGHDAAALAAVAEFGDPQTVMEAFSRDSPIRAASRRLMRTGPVPGFSGGPS